jgi:hypothetical protein
VCAFFPADLDKKLVVFRVTDWVAATAAETF